jgi:acyl-homoserine-lactone acylase
MTHNEKNPQTPQGGLSKLLDFNKSPLGDSGVRLRLQNFLILWLLLFSFFPGVQAKTIKTEILWDKYGVPHIYGKNNQEMYYAFGWAQMSSHADLILKLYAQARGRAAEYFGKEYLDSDKQIMLFDLPGHARNSYLNQDKEYKSYLDAFIQGMNDYAKAHPEAIGKDFKQVLPVTGEDILSHTLRVINLEFLASDDLYGVKRLIAPGSNSMAIAPSKSQSGKAMLVSNPHLPWNDFFLWYEAHLNSQDINVYGVALVGMPVLTIAFNNNLGWTHTVNTIDASDRYELTLTDGGYLLDGKTEPFEIKNVTLKVKQEDGSLQEQKLQFKYSKHGPVAGEKGNKAWAIRIAGMDNSRIIEQYHKMERAGNLNEFESALKMLQNPMFNVVYADKSGNILYVFNGNVPVRNKGDFAFWHGTVDGTDSKLIWQKTHPYEDLPRVLNPPKGFLQNCNDAPWVCTYPPVLKPENYPAYMAPLGTYWRAQRAVNMIKDNPSITFDQLVAYKLNTGMEVADRFLDDLLSCTEKFPGTEALEAAVILNAWDRKTDNNSKGAVLFATWWNDIRNDMFEKPWDKDNPVTTPSGLKDKKQAVELLVKAYKTVKEKYGKADIAWGEVNRFRIGAYDYPANGGPDNFGIFRTMYYADDKDNKKHAIAGDTYIAVTEFGDKVKASVLLGYGNATQPGNKHAGDQLGMLSEKKLRPALLEKDAIRQNLEKQEYLPIEKLH